MQINALVMLLTVYVFYCTWISGFRMDFWISRWISGFQSRFQSGFLDFKVDFDQFLSVTIDAGNIKYNWEVINFTAPRVINMAKALVPAMLRVGGTSGNFIIFEETTKNQTSH